MNSQQPVYRENPPVNVNFLNRLILGPGEVGDGIVADEADGDDDESASPSRLVDFRGSSEHSWLFCDVVEDCVEERDRCCCCCSWSARTSSSLTSQADIRCCCAVVSALLSSRISTNLEAAIVCVDWMRYLLARREYNRDSVFSPFCFAVQVSTERLTQ